MNRVLDRQLSVREGAEVMGVSERHGWRMLAAYRKEGAAALVHGNRGRAPVNVVGKEVKERVLELAQGRYEKVNHSHLTELLEEREAIRLSRSSVRRTLVNAGIKSPRKRRGPKHRSRRERYPQEGMLLQMDGSSHDWLEGRGPHLSLLGAIDDATGAVPFALFRNQEDAQGYFELLKGVIKARGIPMAVYTDQHGIFRRSTKEEESLEEQLAGERKPTQFGRALEELGVRNIFALSPQAKGRVERLWGTLQDRLVSLLRLAGTRTIAEANSVLWDYLPEFNRRFAVPPAEKGSSYRRPSAITSLEGILCFKYERTVASDNTVQFGHQSIQLLAELRRESYAHARVEVQERLDGSLAITYKGRVIASCEAPPEPAVLRARTGARSLPNQSVHASLGIGVRPRTGLTKAGTGPTMRGVTRPGTDPEKPNLLPIAARKPYRPPANHPWREPRLTKSLNT